MKVAHILPEQFKHLTQYSEIQMILAHQLASSKLVQTWLKQVSKEAYVMVDNDSIEVHSGDVDEESEYLALVNSYARFIDEVVLPDVPYDGEATVVRGKLAYRRLPKFKKIVIVPQGRTLEEYLDCALELQKIVPREKRVLGINRCCMRWEDPITRVALLSHLKSRIDISVDIHLLGIHKNPKEELTTVAKSFPAVRSVDTAAAYAYAQHEIDLTHADPIPPKPSADWKVPFNRSKIHYLARNQVQLELWASKGR